MIQTGPDGVPGRNVPAAVEQKDAQGSVEETYVGERQMGVYKLKRRGVSTKNAQVCKNVREHKQGSLEFKYLKLMWCALKS